MGETLYRPYLSLNEIKILYNKLSSEEPEEVTLKRKFQLLVIKADLGAVEGSYKTTPRKSLEDKLELTSDEDFMKRIAERTQSGGS